MVLKSISKSYLYSLIIFLAFTLFPAGKILSYLEYNILHWGGTNPTHLIKLVNSQKRTMRTIASQDDRLTHTTPLFCRFKILKLLDLYKFHSIVDTFIKMKTGYYNVTHERQTRSCRLALPRFHRLTRTQQSVTFSGPTWFNTLPDEIRNTPQLSIFKIKLKNHLLEQYGQP